MVVTGKATEVFPGVVPMSMYDYLLAHKLQIFSNKNFCRNVESLGFWRCGILLGFLGLYVNLRRWREFSRSGLSHFQWLTSKDLEGPIDSHQFTHAQNFPGWGRTDELWLIREPQSFRFSDPFRFGRDREPVSTGPWRREKKGQVATRESGACCLQNKSHVDDFGHTHWQRRKSDNRFQVIISKDLRTYFADICHPPGIEGRVLNAEKERRFCSFIIGCCRWPVFSGRLCPRSFWVNLKLIPQSCFFWVDLQSGNQPAPTKQDLSGHYSERTYKHGTAMCLSILPCWCAPFGLAQQRIDLDEALQHLRSEQLEKSSQRVVQRACK